MSKSFYGSSKFEIQKWKPDTLLVAYFLSRLAFQNKKFVEQSNIMFGLFLDVFIFLSIYELFYWWI